MSDGDSELDVVAPAPVVLEAVEPAPVVLEMANVGPRGPAGTGGDLSFVFTQNVAATAWSITHNLGKRPSVSVFDSGGSGPFEGDVLHVNDTSLTVTFAFAFSGVAYLN